MADGDGLLIDDEVTEEVGQSADSLWTAVLEALPRLGIALAITAVGYVLSRLIRHVTERILLGRRGPSYAQVMSKIVSWIVFGVVVGAAVAITFPSVQPVDLLAGLGFFSVAVGFAFQDILENTLSGVLLLFRQPFRSGDEIEVNGNEGTVEAITIRETRITRYDGQLLVVPNRDVYKNAIRVQTSSRLRRIMFVVGVGYDDDLDMARAVITDALGALDCVADQPGADALVTEFGPSSINLEVTAWVRSDHADARVARDSALRAVKRALDAAEITMPAPVMALQATSSLRAALGTRGPKG